MKVSIIVAVGENNAIGKDNQLLWHLPRDMKFFKEKTMGHIVVSGRKNYESIPEKFRPLPGRTNIIITHNTNYTLPGALVMHSIDEALEYARSIREEEVFIIGGGEIYNLVRDRNLADRIYLTRVKSEFTADTFFRPLDEEGWKLKQDEQFLKDEKNMFDLSFQIWEK